MSRIASHASLDTSGFTSVSATARAVYHAPPMTGFREPANQAAPDDVVREAVGVFHSGDDLQKAIDELLRSGFHRSALSLLASEAEVVAKLGHLYQKTADLISDPEVPRVAYVSPEAISGGQGAVIGTLMYVAAGILIGPVAAARGGFAALAAAAALAATAGGLAGGWLAQLIGHQHARRIQEHLDRGGLLLWVRTWNRDQEHRATDILTRSSAEDVHVQQCYDGACIPA